MGKADISMKHWLKNKERFADLFNTILFNGQPIIRPEELQEIDSQSCLSIQTKSGKTKDVQRYRDIIMRWHDEMDLALLACENQEKVHYAMPVRNMIYDGLSYADQMGAIWNSLSKGEKKRINTEDFFSRFRKEDTLCLVITFVLYYGEEEWDGSIDLYEMFRITNEKVHQVFESFVPNYRINLIDAGRITETSHFQTDIQIMFEMLKYRQNTKELLKFINEHNDYFSHMDFESRQAMAVFLRTEKYMRGINQRETEEIDMCKALEDWFNEAHETGMNKGIEQGRSEGFESGKLDGLKIGIKNTITALRMHQTSDDIIVSQIAELYNMPEKEVRMYM